MENIFSKNILAGIGAALGITTLGIGGKLAYDKYYESGAHFKYLSLYNELQKLFKIQNYSLPKKKIKKRKDILNSENNNDILKQNVDKTKPLSYFG